MLLEKEPNNIQAQSLKQLIEAAVAKGASFFPLVPSTSFFAPAGTETSAVSTIRTEGYVGMAIAGGAAAAAGILFAAFMGAKGRR